MRIYFVVKLDWYTWSSYGCQDLFMAIIITKWGKDCCEVAAKVWHMVLNWVNLNFITPPNLASHLDCWFNEVCAKKVRNGLLLIWHATVWTIWLERNDRIFKGVNKEVGKIFDAVKTLSWCWCLNRLKIGAFMFFEWYWNPRDCLAR